MKKICVLLFTGYFVFHASCVLAKGVGSKGVVDTKKVLVTKQIQELRDLPVVAKEEPMTKLEQYTYVALQLGLLDSSKPFWRNYCGFLKKYSIELAALAGLAVGGATFFAVEKGYLTLPRFEWLDTLSWRSGAAAGAVAIVTVACFYFLHNFCGKLFADDADWYQENLTGFIQNWSEHKQFTPVELHQFFDELVKHEGPFDAALVQEVYRTVAQGMIKTAQI